jgi:hypothetical protein
MDSHKHSAQVERLEVVETGRRRRWTEEGKLKIVVESLLTASHACAPNCPNIPGLPSPAAQLKPLSDTEWLTSFSATLVPIGINGGLAG